MVIIIASWGKADFRRKKLKEKRRKTKINKIIFLYMSLILKKYEENQRIISILTSNKIICTNTLQDVLLCAQNDLAIRKLRWK